MLTGMRKTFSGEKKTQTLLQHILRTYLFIYLFIYLITSINPIEISVRNGGG
jgi:hypothetical protein